MSSIDFNCYYCLKNYNCHKYNKEIFIGECNEYLTSMVMVVTPVIDYSMLSLCRMPYLDHKNGCINWNKKEGCPPNVQMFDKVYDISEPVYAIVNKFPFGSHVERMKSIHPNWTDRQAECCLYWQNTARKQLSKEIEIFEQEFMSKGYKVEKCPEAMGVNITQTLKNLGIELEWPPKNFTYQVALAGKLKNKQESSQSL